MMPQLTEVQQFALRIMEGDGTQADVASALGVSKYRARAIVRDLCDKFDCDYGWELADAAREARTPAPALDDADDGRTHV